MEARAVHYSSDINCQMHADRYSGLDLFESAFKYAAIGMALVDLNGRWIKVNKALCHVVGYSEKEMLMTDFQTITHPDDLQQDLEFLNSLVVGEIDTYQLEKRYFHKNGNIVWILLSVSLAREDDGKPAFFISQIKDITEKKQAAEALRKSEQRFHDMANQVPGLVYQYVWYPDAPARFTYVSNKANEFFGTEQLDFLAKSFNIIHWIHPEDRMSYLNTLETCSQDLKYRYWEGRRLPQDGKDRWFSISAMPSMQADGSVLWSGILQDITARKLLDAQLADTLSVHESLLSSLREGVMLINAEHVVEACNASAERILGISESHMLKQKLFNHGWVLLREDGSPMPENESPFEVSIKTGQYVLDAIVGISMQGSAIKWLSVNSIPLLRSGESEPYAAMLSFSDYTNSKKMLEDLETKANTDFLTGAYNRRHLFELARYETERALRYERPLSLLMIDIDYFKKVNDQYGHQVGDQVLIELVGILKRELRTVDVVGRWGGEEFAVMLPETSFENSIMIANRICAAVARHKINHHSSQHELSITISIGVAQASLHTNNLDKLFRRADEALYNAKAQGRNRVCIAE